MSAKRSGPATTRRVAMISLSSSGNASSARRSSPSTMNSGASRPALFHFAACAAQRSRSSMRQALDDGAGARVVSECCDHLEPIAEDVLQLRGQRVDAHRLNVNRIECFPNEDAAVERRVFWRRHRPAQPARRIEEQPVAAPQRGRHDVRQRRQLGAAARRTGGVAARRRAEVRAGARAQRGRSAPRAAVARAVHRSRTPRWTADNRATLRARGLPATPAAICCCR